MRRLRHGLSVVTAAIVLASCAAVEHQRGYVPDQEALQSLVVGTDTKQTVTEKLGNPTVAGTFNSNIWYYISSHDVQTAFFASHPVDRNIVAVEFNNAGQVANIKRYGMADSRAVDYVERETPTMGRNTSILQQIFNAVPGNIGQQAPNQDTNAGGGGAPPP
jgi:outer membrane protein assembly factor BamE (lipoprotein component of BamABCDE complex)